VRSCICVKQTTNIYPARFISEDGERCIYQPVNESRYINPPNKINFQFKIIQVIFDSRQLVSSFTPPNLREGIYLFLSDNRKVRMKYERQIHDAQQIDFLSSS